MTVEAPAYTALELDVMRGALALAILLSLEALQMFAPRTTGSHPVGLARVVDLGWITRLRRPLHRVAQVAVVALALDVGTPWALLYLAAFIVTHVTAASSDGAVNHGHHLVAVVTLAQLAAIVVWNVAGAVGLDAGDWFADTRAATAAWWSVQAIVAVYFTSGVSKLLAGAGDWTHRSPGLLVAAIARLDMAGAMGGARAQLAAAARSRRLIDVLLPRPRLTRGVFAAGLVVELAAPLALLGPDAMLVVGLGLLALHVANGLLLGLPFPSYQLLVLGYLVNVPRLLA